MDWRQNNFTLHLFLHKNKLEYYLNLTKKKIVTLFRAEDHIFPLFVYKIFKI